MITGAEIVDDARKYLGVPYKFGGRALDGLDCLGLLILVACDFGFGWQCETPQQTENGVPWAKIIAITEQFNLQQVAHADAQLGDLVFLGVPFGDVGTVKMISGMGGLRSFFGVSRFINFRTATILEESGPGIVDMIEIRRKLKIDIQEYVKRLWRIYRYPFVATS